MTASHFHPPLWIDESPITLCQRVRLQRGRTFVLHSGLRVDQARNDVVVVAGGYSVWCEYVLQRFLDGRGMVPVQVLDTGTNLL